MKKSRGRPWRLVPAAWLAVGLSAISAAGLSLNAAAEPAPIEGEYQCDDCQGYLKIQKQRAGAYKVWLGVGGGSCGAEVLVERSVRYAGGPLTVAHALNGKRCTATVDFSEAGATVSDSCFTSEDEKGSTCALLGAYSRQGK